ncbi:hypothetical protein JJC03_14090 [Flavobacterium oreochromis]|uniref:hypothetical protein n=1 Tax=Flavobacterium oreochromis TaxID=2906078 RepID=UPI001CE51DC3|nr:hypothetical protein [Flavobacterium oreochromis]QYS86109.1 hypothetical protein JJC03_14090 [Flavobacterium oreochromis]
MIKYNISFYSKNYYPSEKIKWIRDNSSDTKNLIIFKACLYNSIKKKKLYPLTLWTIYNEIDNSCVLLIGGGKLKFWFHQEYVKDELTIDEYVECAKLLHTELDFNFNYREERFSVAKNVLLFHKNNEYRYYFNDFYLSDKKLDEFEKMIYRIW